MLDKDLRDPKTGKPLASRALHIVGPDKKVSFGRLTLLMNDQYMCDVFGTPQEVVRL